MGWNQKMVNYESGSDGQKSKQEIQGHKATTHHPIDAQFELMGTGVPISLDKATKLPIAEIASLGAVFTSVPQSFRTVAQSIAPAATIFTESSCPKVRQGRSKPRKRAAPTASPSCRTARRNRRRSYQQTVSSRSRPPCPTTRCHVFRNSPDRACEGGVRVCEADTRIPPPPPRTDKPSQSRGLFLCSSPQSEYGGLHCDNRLSKAKERPYGRSHC